MKKFLVLFCLVLLNLSMFAGGGSGGHGDDTPDNPSGPGEYYRYKILSETVSEATILDTGVTKAFEFQAPTEGYKNYNIHKYFDRIHTIKLNTIPEIVDALYPAFKDSMIINISDNIEWNVTIDLTPYQRYIIYKTFSVWNVEKKIERRYYTEDQLTETTLAWAYEDHRITYYTSLLNEASK